jgi:hypothetical protein
VEPADRLRAALRLAMENPQAKFVRESVEKYQGNEYKQLVAEFGSEAKAAGVVTAIHSVDQTQFVYARYARSRLFRGTEEYLLRVPAISSEHVMDAWE